MKYLIIIHGLPAVGKTSIARKILRCLGSKLTTAIIQGDFFAHMIYGCTYKNSELDIKYKNMKMVIESFLSQGVSVLVDDHFRRNKDIRMFINLANNQKAELIIFRLLADKQMLLQRNRIRDYWDWIEDGKISAYADGPSHSFPEEICLDNSAEEPETTVSRILGYLEKCGVFEQRDKNILDSTFRPIEE